MLNLYQFINFKTNIKVLDRNLKRKELITDAFTECSICLCASYKHTSFNQYLKDVTEVKIFFKGSEKIRNYNDDVLKHPNIKLKPKFVYILLTPMLVKADFLFEIVSVKKILQLIRKLQAHFLCRKCLGLCVLFPQTERLEPGKMKLLSQHPSKVQFS